MKLKVGFTKEIKPDFVSKCIMRVLGTNYSHVFFILNDFIYHSTGEGVNRVPLAAYLEDHEVVKTFDVELPTLSEEAFAAYMEGAGGKEYSNSQYIGFVLPFLQRFVSNGSEKMICSELVSVVLAKYGHYKLPKQADFMSPKDVEILLT